MKKTGVVAVLVLVLAGSCATTTVWDKSYPQEQSVDILFGMLTVKSYNGIGVKGWKYNVTLPAGEINIGGDVYIYHAGVRFLAHDMEFVCYLEPSKKYTIIGATKDGQWGVSVYEGNSLWVGTAPDSSKLLEFIPFKNQPDTFN
jgi:hypothetical protein